MPEHLTPARIGLLVLIELYTERLVPWPARGAVISFILNQLLGPKSHTTSPSTEDLPFVLTLNSFEALLSAHQAVPNIPFGNSYDILRFSVWDRFLTKLWAISSVDALHEFFLKRMHLLGAGTKPKPKKVNGVYLPPPFRPDIVLSRASPLARFVRRSKADFDRLNFRDVVSLWTSFVRWRQESDSYWHDRISYIERYPFNQMNMEHIQRDAWAGGCFGDRTLIEGVEGWGQEPTKLLAQAAYGRMSIEEQEGRIVMPYDDVGGRISTEDVRKLLEFQMEQLRSQSFHLPRPAPSS